MKYLINSIGQTIMADLAFVTAHYPGDFTLIPDDPAPTKRVLTHLEYMNRFSDAELIAIYTAAKTVVQIEVWLAKFNAASEINLDDAKTISGLAGLEGVGLIALGRAQEIRA